MNSAVAEPPTKPASSPPAAGPGDTPDCQQPDCLNCAEWMIKHVGDPEPANPGNVELAACTEHVGALLTFRDDLEPRDAEERWEVRAV